MSSISEMEIFYTSILHIAHSLTLCWMPLFGSAALANKQGSTLRRDPWPALAAFHIPWPCGAWVGAAKAKLGHWNTSRGGLHNPTVAGRDFHRWNWLDYRGRRTDWQDLASREPREVAWRVHQTTWLERQLDPWAYHTWAYLPYSTAANSVRTDPTPFCRIGVE